MSQETADVKPKLDGESMEIGIKMQDGSEVKFRVKGHTPFQKVFNAWAGKKGVNVANYRFIRDGQRVYPHETPASIDCEDGDTLDAMQEQLGGC